MVALGAAQVYAFENTLRRYSVSEIGSLKVFLIGSPPWAPPGGNLLLLVLFTLLVAVAGWLTLRIALTDRRDAPDTAIAAAG